MLSQHWFACSCFVNINVKTVRRLGSWTEVHVTFLAVSELRRKIVELRLSELVVAQHFFFPLRFQHRSLRQKVGCKLSHIFAVTHALHVVPEFGNGVTPRTLWNERCTVRRPTIMNFPFLPTHARSRARTYTLITAHVLAFVG